MSKGSLVLSILAIVISTVSLLVNLWVYWSVGGKFDWMIGSALGLLIIGFISTVIYGYYLVKKFIEKKSSHQ